MADKHQMVDGDGKPVTLFGLPIYFTDEAMKIERDDLVLKAQWLPEQLPDPLDDAPSWFCGCGGLNADPKGFLRDLLNAFADENSCGSPYVSLPAFTELYKTYPASTVELVLYLLDHMGYVEHGGSVSSSAWLTGKGEKLREWANR